MKNFFKQINLIPIENTSTFKNVHLAQVFLLKINLLSFGKGFSKKEALTSAYGEMCERILTRNFLEEYYIPTLHKDAIITERFLTQKLYDIYKIEELEKEDLIDFNTDIFEILSIPFTNPKIGEIVYFPINLIQNLYASNGMAFHTDLKKAYYNAKTEVIERFVKYEVVKYGLSLPKIDHPFNNNQIQIYDATLGGKYPVIAALYKNKDKIILSFGCDLDFETAVKKAYLELMQTSLKNSGKICEDIESVKDSANLIRHFIDLSGDIHSNFFKKPYFKTSKWNFKDLNVFKEDEFIRIYKYKNYQAVHLIIPSISEVYPIEDLAYNNINKGKFIRADILNRTNKEYILDYLNQHMVIDIGAFIGVKFDKHYFPQDIDELYEGYKFADSYLQIQKLAKVLNEI
ncbi:MAG: YcaO-like family protein [Nautiliaceae bacterium]